MWQLDQHHINYKVVDAADYPRLSSLYDTILMPDGISQARIVNGVDPNTVPERFRWARGVGQEGWNQLKQFVLDGGGMVAIGSSGETATTLLGLPVEHAMLPSFRAPGSLMRVNRSAGVPEMWGMPATWATWSESDTGFWSPTTRRRRSVRRTRTTPSPWSLPRYAEGERGWAFGYDEPTFAFEASVTR